MASQLIKSNNPIPFSVYENLSDSEKKILFDHYTKGKTNQSYEIKRNHNVLPNFLPALYSNTPFPHFELSKVKIKLNENDILAGWLYMEQDNCVKIKVRLQWNGYVSQLYDGQLYLGVIRPEAKIIGSINDKEIEFKDDKMVNKVWPGFLTVYS